MMSGFGLERLGLVALKYPRITLLLVVAVTAPLLYQATRVSFASDISEIFRSNSPDFVQFEEVRRLYPDSDTDILLVVEGPNLFTRDNLERLRMLHLELDLTESVRYVLSMFSARRPPRADGTAAPLFPADLAEIDDLEKLKAELRRHPLVARKLMSDDGHMALIIVALEGRHDIASLRRVTGVIQQTAADILEGSGLQVRPTGLSYMRIEIIGAIIRDQAIFSAAGFAIGFALSMLFLRSIVFAVIAAIPALLAPGSVLGLMQLRDQEVTVLTSVVPALVMVLVYADALHLLFSIRRNLAAGRSTEEALTEAVIRIGPACVLTSLTTTLALLSLTVVPHPFVSRFGFSAAIGTAIAYAATLTTVPAVARLLLGGRPATASAVRQTDMIQTAIEALCSRVAHVVRFHPRPVLTIGVLLTVSAGVLYTLAQPRYQYREYLPKGNPALEAMENIDAKLAGTETLLLFIQWPEGTALETRENLDIIDKAHQLLERPKIVKEVSSLHSVELWLTSGGMGSDEIFRFLREARSPLSSRLVSPESNSVLLSGHFSGTDSTVLLPVLASLEKDLAEMRAEHPDLRLILTGLPAVSARASHVMINQLNWSLLSAICLIILFIGLALRSVRASLVSVLPNLLPIALAGSLLYVTGQDLQFNSVVAFILGFGIAVDNTIHMLNRFGIARWRGADTGAALETAIMTVGPVLIVSTVVLASGLGGTILSVMPSMRLFGLLCIILLVSALASNLILLPALMSVIEKPSRGD